MYALIIAGGKGERLRPLTDSVPKPMLPLAGKPLAEYQVHTLRAAGVTDIVFLTGYLSDIIREHFGDGSDFGVRIHYSHEETPLGRGGGLRKGFSKVPSDEEAVLVLNGDVITGANIHTLLDDYRTRLAANPEHCVTILTAPMRSPYGIVDTAPDGLVTDFREKIILPYAINAGMYVMNRAIEHLLPEIGDHETETFPELVAAGRVSAVPTDEFWRSVDSHKDMREAEKYLKGKE